MHHIKRFHPSITQHKHQSIMQNYHPMIVGHCQQLPTPTQKQKVSAFLCKDIPIFEKLKQSPILIRKSKAKKRSLEMAANINIHSTLDAMVPLSKRQRMTSNVAISNQSCTHTSQTTIQLQQKQPSRSQQEQQLCSSAVDHRLDKRLHQCNNKKRQGNSFGYNTHVANSKLQDDTSHDGEPHLKRRRLLCESNNVHHSTTTRMPQNNPNRDIMARHPTTYNPTRNIHYQMIKTIQQQARHASPNGNRNKNIKCPNKVASCRIVTKQETGKCRKTPNIMFIPNILNDVLSYLDFSEIFKLGGLSKFHEKEFYIGFGINKKLNDENFNLYFEYNNGYIVNILKKQISNNLLNIAMYGLQCINYKMGKWFIKNSVPSSNKNNNCITTTGERQKLSILSFHIHSGNKNDYIFEWSKNTQMIVECAGEDAHTSYLHTSTICTNVINPLFEYCGCRFKLHNENTFSFITRGHTQSNDNVNNCCSTGNSCNNGDCNSKFCCTRTGFIYSTNINPFRELHSQMKQLRKQISCSSFDVNHVTEYMIIGNIYHINPLCNTFDHLLHSNNYFRQTLMNKKAECVDIDKNNNNLKLYKHGNHLTYLWKNMRSVKCCFSWCDRWNGVVHGRPFLFSDLSLRGDFGQYQKFMQFEQSKPENVNRKSKIKKGTDALVAMFLRLDILDEMIYLPTRVPFTHYILLFLLKPKLLLQYKQNLLDSMIPLTKSEEYEFALYDNPRYSPDNRIKFLWKLLFSTKFARMFNQLGLLLEDHSYIDLRKRINKLKNSFDVFRKEWELDKYKTFVHNETKQRQLYHDFQIVIQALFGFCAWYSRNNGRKTGIYTIANMIEQGRENGITTANEPDGMIPTEKQDLIRVCLFAAQNIHDKFINVLPRTEDELRSLWNVMTHEADVYTVKHGLQYPRFDKIFQSKKKPRCARIVFASVSNLNVFVSNLWEIGQRLNCT